jgi:hypothetical protein
MTRDDRARREADKAAAEAGAIGGQTSSDPDPVDEEQPDQAHRPLVEAGQGEAEGFEEAERDLIEHASHADQHAACRVIDNAPDRSEDARAPDAGEADQERSSERSSDAG